LQARISHPRFKMLKIYWVQVEGEISNEALDELRRGVRLKDGLTQPAQARIIDPPLGPRNPPIRFRRNIPTSWLELSISEGKNRQVRRMTAAVGYPTLRLHRQQIGDWNLGTLTAGQYMQLDV
jgi:23S rRNA pseudouridine2457 synthase